MPLRVPEQNKTDRGAVLVRFLELRKGLPPARVSTRTWSRLNLKPKSKGCVQKFGKREGNGQMLAVVDEYTQPLRPLKCCYMRLVLSNLQPDVGR